MWLLFLLKQHYASLLLYFFILLVQYCWFVENTNALIYLQKHEFQLTLVDKSEQGEFPYPITLHLTSAVFIAPMFLLFTEYIRKDSIYDLKTFCLGT